VTLICSHRVNDPGRLDDIPTRFGVEIDLRSDGHELVLEHDPFLGGPSFTTWLKSYRHAFIVVNIKEEGLETRIIESLEAAGVTQWAFLDQSFPFMVKTLRSGSTKTMVRFSEFESMETIVSLPMKPDWVWVDSFTGKWPNATDLVRLANLGHRFMLVSPELQGRDLVSEIDAITSHFVEAGVPIHGVCTKQPSMWERPEASWWAS
jgi:hypothetical protein